MNARFLSGMHAVFFFYLVLGISFFSCSMSAEASSAEAADLSSWPPLIQVSPEESKELSPIQREMLDFMVLSSVPDRIRERPLGDRGDVILRLEPPKTSALVKYYNNVRAIEWLPRVIQRLNQTIALPNDIYLTFQECKEKTAFYDPEYAQVMVCYELLDALHDQARGDERLTPAHADAFATSAGFVTAMHEVGHALIDQLRIPVHEQEEKIADELVLVLLMQHPEESRPALDAFVNTLTAPSSLFKKELVSIPYWKQHGLTLERAHSLSCLIYGSSPHVYITQLSYYPVEALAQCEQGFPSHMSAWDTLLLPYYLPTFLESQKR